MKFITPPTFAHGLKIACDLESLIYLINHEEQANDPYHFHSLIHSPLQEFGEIVRKLHGTIQLDSGHPKAQQIQRIWNRFYRLSSNPSSNAAELFCAKKELVDWLDEQSATGSAKILQKMPSAFHESPLVVSDFIDSQILHPIPNLVSTSELDGLKNLYKIFLSKTYLKGSNAFKKEVRQSIAALLSYSEGRRQIQSLLNAIEQSPQKIEILIAPGPLPLAGEKTLGADSSDGQLKIYWIQFTSHPLHTLVTVNPQTGGKRSRYFPKEITLFHELQHVLHALTQTSPAVHPPLNEDSEIYGSIEEMNTILGSSDHQFLSENSFRQNLNLSPRYGHIPGYIPTKTPTENLAHAIEYNLSEDFIWLVPVLTPSQISDILTNQKFNLRQAYIHSYQLPYFDHLLSQLDQVSIQYNTQMAFLLQHCCSSHDLWQKAENLANNTNRVINNLITGSFLIQKQKETLRGIYSLTQYMQIKDLPTLFPSTS